MKENQRIRLSKQLLRESLITLMAQKSIHKISVREICEIAQINRTTFYKYYGSQYDLLKDMENEALTQIDGYLSGCETPPKNDMQLFVQVVTYIQNNLSLFRLLVNNTVDSAFPERLLNLPRIQRLLSEQLKAEYEIGSLDYMYQFVVNGGFCIIKRWLNKEEREPPEKIALVLASMLSKLFP